MTIGILNSKWQSTGLEVSQGWSDSVRTQPVFAPLWTLGVSTQLNLQWEPASMTAYKDLLFRWRLDWCWESTSKLVCLLAGISSSLAIGRKPQFSAMWALPILPVQNRHESWLSSKWAIWKWAEMSNRAPQTEIVVFPTLNAEEMLIVSAYAAGHWDQLWFKVFTTLANS